MMFRFEFYLPALVLFFIGCHNDNSSETAGGTTSVNMSPVSGQKSPPTQAERISQVGGTAPEPTGPTTMDLVPGGAIKPDEGNAGGARQTTSSQASGAPASGGRNATAPTVDEAVQGGEAVAGQMVGGDAGGQTVGGEAGGQQSGMSRAEALWQALRTAIDESDLRHVSFVFGDAEGQLFAHDKGERGVNVVTPLASASKWLTAILAMKLVEAGVMSLDDTPQTYLDWWSRNGNDDRSRVTLRQLLSFTSGFVGGTGLGNEGGIPCVEDPNTTIEQCAQAIHDSGSISEGGYFAYEPGTHYFYGPGHMHIAAAMMEQATGLRFNALFRREITAPLGLRRNSIGFVIPSIPNARAAGGGQASALAYSVILQNLVAGHLLSDESIRLMTADQTGGGITFADGGVPPLAQTFGAWHYAMGAWRECNSPMHSPACDGPGVISSPGAFGYYPWWDRQNGTWGVLSTRVLINGSALSVPIGKQWRELANRARTVHRGLDQ
ncbi:MAG: serine hydrolase [Myxococcota bacterium]|nr:serine hydrolase [Myxococcota bacterium]